jgi:iron complex outermembrane receptor protein
MFCRGAPAALTSNCTFGPGFRGITRNQSAVQDTRTYAVFAQADWHFASAWTLTVGGRFTQEEKDVTGYQRPTLPYQNDVAVDCPNVSDALNGQGTPVAFPCPAPAINSNAGSFSRDANDFSPNLTLRYKPRNDQMLYATFAQGFKSGGFVLWPIVAQANLAQDVDFDDEKTVHFEVGGKHDLWEGRGRFNWAAWHTRFEDIQVSALDPVLLVQSVANAAQATSQGLEGDVLWSFGRSLNLTGSFAYTDAKFDEYTGAPCYFSQTAATGCIGGVQDLSGVQLPYAPKWQFSAGMNGSMPVGERYTVGYDLLYFWRDDQYLQLDHDAIDFQSAYGKVNATLSFGREGGMWRVALVGKNLTDKLTANFSNDSAALGATGGNPHFKFVEAPRSVTLQVRAEF